MYIYHIGISNFKNFLIKHIFVHYSDDRLNNLQLHLPSSSSVSIFINCTQYIILIAFFHQFILVAEFASFETNVYRDTNMPHFKYAHWQYKQKFPCMKYFLSHQYALMVQTL